MAEHSVALVREAAEIVAPTEVPPGACRDPDDLPVLGTVLAGRADWLVTGDQDLLVLGEFRGHLILSPRQFQDRLR
jgi:putative PIN family toxin of toxin-antitoxin system